MLDVCQFQISHHQIFHHQIFHHQIFHCQVSHCQVSHCQISYSQIPHCQMSHYMHASFKPPPVRSPTTCILVSSLPPSRLTMSCSLNPPINHERRRREVSWQFEDLRKIRDRRIPSVGGWSPGSDCRRRIVGESDDQDGVRIGPHFPSNSLLCERRRRSIKNTERRRREVSAEFDYLREVSNRQILIFAASDAQGESRRGSDSHSNSLLCKVRRSSDCVFGMEPKRLSSWAWNINPLSIKYYECSAPNNYLPDQQYFSTAD